MAAILGLGVVGCRSERLLEPDQTGDRKTQPSGSVQAQANKRPAPGNMPKIRFLPAGDGDVAALVKTERATAESGNRAFLVYVGASWCEPCQQFHEAASHGDLDSELPEMTLLEFDADKDVPRLRQAGYSSTYIPLFALPATDGRSSGKFIEGGIKGEGAAKELAPRLKKLLGS